MKLTKLIVILIVRNFRKLKGLYAVYLKTGLIIPTSSKVCDIENIDLGENASIGEQCSIICQTPTNKAAKGRIKIGNNLKLNINVMINADCGGEIIIGDNVLIGPNVTIRASDHNTQNRDVLIINQGHIPGRILIENNVWIGAHAVLLPNIKIGEGAVIAAGAVVTKDVLPFTIVGGIPARLIKAR